MSQASSLRSSLDLADNEGPVPVQITEQDAPKPSLLRRFSSATQSFLLTNSKASSGHRSEAFDHDIAGSHHLHETFASSSDEELTMQDFLPEKYEEDGESRPFWPDNAVPEGEAAPPLRRRESTVVSAIQNFSKKFGFWDKEFISHRNKIIITLLQNYLFILVGFTIALCIYWGVYYDRPSRYKNIQFAVVLGDSSEGGLLEIVRQFFLAPSVQAYGRFDVYNHTRIAALAQKHNVSIEAEVVRQVHHQHYRAAFFVHENATLAMQTALGSADASFSPASDLLTVMYETGSDYNAMTNYVSTIVQQLCMAFFTAMAQSPWTPTLLGRLSETQFAALVSQAPNLLTQVPNFRVDDRLPVPEQVVQAPLQIGLIYLCIFTFFQFLLSMPIQRCVVAKLKGWRFVVFRILTAQSSYFVLSFGFVALNRSFGIPTDKAFGRLGFLVVWAFGFLTMSSVGSLIEILVLVCVVLKPAMIGLVLLMVAVLNLAPTINPIYLCPDFYRYGYAMPVYNAYHLLQVAFFDSWKGHVGRHIGILLAWSIVTNAMMPLALKWVGRKMEEKRLAAEAQPVTTSAYSEAVTKGTQDLLARARLLRRAG